MRRLVLAASAALTLAGTVPASAQYYRDRDYGYDRPPLPPRGYDRDRYDDDDRPPPRRRFYRGGGSVCVTARGSCPYPPAPFNAGCGCDIPGFGYKRGAIGG